MTVWQDRLRSILRNYPATAKNRRRSRLIETDNHYEIAFSFNKSRLDRVDKLLVAFAADRVNAKRCEPSDGRPATDCYRCNEEQAIRMLRYLSYATIVEPREVSSGTLEGRTPLHVLLTSALSQFTKDYEAAPSAKGRPRLAVWSNVLQVLANHKLTLKEIGQSAITANRTTKVVVKASMAAGLINADPPESMLVRTRFELSKLGKLMRNAGKRRVTTVTTKWAGQYGTHFERLLSSLQAIDSKLELEYPNHITGYGPADESLTGGSILPAETKPTRIPGRGMEWPVVPRDSDRDRSDVPLSTLLSHVLTQFALDYEGEGQGRLGLTTLFHQYLPDDGMSLSEARRLTPINGKGTSLHERHVYIVLDPGKPSDGSRLVYPTQKSRIARDAYPHLAMEIEQQWAERYGRRTMSNLRKSLEALVVQWDDDSKGYPDTTSWMSPWFQPYLIVSETQ